VLTTIRKAEYAELVTLFLLQGAALGMWFVPLSTVLDANGLHALKPYAYACSALAALVSPLIFGAMADRQASPVRVLRGLALATAAAITLAGAAIQGHGRPWLVLALVQLYALCASPTWSVSSTIIFTRLADAKQEFGPIRAMATLGWMAGCWLVSALGADTRPLAFYVGAGLWLAVSGFTFFLPELETPRSAKDLSWHERLGWDALSLLKNPDHRVVFLITALFAVPLCGFYPYTPPHLRELGFRHTSAWMSLGQVTEIMALFALGRLLLRWRLKWILAGGLVLGVARFVGCALDTKGGLLAGVLLHGGSFSLVFVTAQIYLDQRVAHAWRARAQALMSLMTGVGNLTGYLGVGWWFAASTRSDRPQWPLFWGGLAALAAMVLAYFLVAYHGVGRGLKRADLERLAAAKFPLGLGPALAYRPAMRPLRALVIYLAVVFLGGALLAPWLYWLAQSFAADFPKLAHAPFHRFVNRSLLVLALAGLWPLLRGLGARSAADLGLVKPAGHGRELGEGFLFGFLSLAIVAALALAAGASSLKAHLSFSSVAAKLAAAALTAVVVAVLEEILFRGGVFGGLRRVLPWWWALAVSSAIYALVHFLARTADPATVTWTSGFSQLGLMLAGFTDWRALVPGFFNLALAGAWLALAYQRTGNLCCSIGLHAGWIFWLKTYGALTTVAADANLWLWGGSRLIDGWLALGVLALTLAVFSRLRPAEKPRPAR
jgi:membrane protease YdiL (CAAX protease family)